MDPVELRKKNFVPPDAFPYQTPVACVYDSGQYAKAIDEACKMADYAGFPKRKADAAKKGKLRGIGFCAYIEACGIAPTAVVGALGAGVGLWEAAQIRFNATGPVFGYPGAPQHVQGPEQ